MFLDQGQPAGVEADLARELGHALGRPVEFITLKKSEQIASLVVNEVDILMNGMTPEKMFAHVTFTLPYSTSGPRVWAMRAANPDMIGRVNKQLARWYADGTINRVLEKANLPQTAPKQLPTPPPPVPVILSNTAPAALQPGLDARSRVR